MRVSAAAGLALGLVCALCCGLARGSEDIVVGCGGFVKSDVEINYSLIEVGAAARRFSRPRRAEQGAWRPWIPVLCLPAGPQPGRPAARCDCSPAARVPWPLSELAVVAAWF